MDILQNKVYTVISEFIGKKDEDFYVAFSMLPILSHKQQVKAFTTSMNNIKTHVKELKNKLAENSHTPLNVRGLFFHPIKILETDIEFLEWVLEEIKTGDEQIGPKAYG
jgi:hypothetical protein